MKGVSLKRTALKADVTGKYTVCRRVLASFRPEILQAGSVKGLIIYRCGNGMMLGASGDSSVLIRAWDS